MVKFAVEFWWKMLLTIFPSKRSSKISCQTSPEVRHQFRRKLRQLHSGNRRRLPLSRAKGVEVCPLNKWGGREEKFRIPVPGPPTNLYGREKNHRYEWSCLFFQEIQSEKTPKEIQHKDLFFSPFKILCVCVFPTFQREKQPEHKEFQGLKAPRRWWIQAWDSRWNLCLWVSFSALRKIIWTRGAPKKMKQCPPPSANTKIWFPRVGCPKPLLLRCFLGLTPFHYAVKVHPLNWGGTRCQASWAPCLEQRQTEGQKPKGIIRVDLKILLFSNWKLEAFSAARWYAILIAIRKGNFNCWIHWLMSASSGNGL